jgi:hypothetical protein
MLHLPKRRRLYLLIPAALLVIPVFWLLFHSGPKTPKGYDQIEEGMTEKQVSAILGSGPSNGLETDLGHGHKTCLVWWDQPGIRINVRFNGNPLQKEERKTAVVMCKDFQRTYQPSAIDRVRVWLYDRGIRL